MSNPFVSRWPVPDWAAARQRAAAQQQADAPAPTRDVSELFEESSPSTPVDLFHDTVHLAARRGDHSSVALCLAAAPGGVASAVNSPDFYGNTALYYASLAGHVGVVRFLRQNGAVDDEHQRCWWGAGSEFVRSALREGGGGVACFHHVSRDASLEEAGLLRDRRQSGCSSGSRPSLWVAPDWSAVAASAVQSIPSADEESPSARLSSLAVATQERSELPLPDLQLQASGDQPVSAVEDASRMGFTRELVEQASGDQPVAGVEDALRMGFTREQVEQALQSEPRAAGDGARLIEALLQLQEPETAHVLGGVAASVGVLRTGEALLEKDICKICFDHISDVVFVPCGHLGFCSKCCEVLTDCPVCRARISSRLNVFRV